MPDATHTIVGVDENDSPLKQSAMLGELRSGMEIIARCQNASDADIVRRTWQGMNDEKHYYIIENKK
jgi:hypothetical protein